MGIGKTHIGEDMRTCDINKDMVIDREKWNKIIRVADHNCVEWR